jgi:O-antigen ligase
MRALARRHPMADPMQLGLAATTLIVSLALGLALAGRAPRMVLLALLVAAGAAILLSLTPKIAFVGWLAIAPFFQESASSTTLGHNVSLALYFAPSILFALWSFSRSRGLHPRFLDVLPAAYFLFTLVSAFAAGEGSATTVKGIYLATGIGVALYYFFAVGPVGALSRLNVVAVLLVIAVAEAVMSIIDGTTHWNLWHDSSWQTGDARAIATLANPEVLGTFLGMGIVIAVAILVWDGPAQLRRLAIVTLVAGFPGLYFTLTRMPILATLSGVLIILMTRMKTRLLAVGVLVVSLVVVTASWGRITSSTVYKARITNASNVEARILIQDWSLKLASERPVFGWGYGSFDRVKNDAQLRSGNTPLSFGTTNTSHNTYLTILVELGSVGLLLYLLPWLVIPWHAVGRAVHRRESLWFVVGAVCALGVFVAAANTGDFKFFSFVPAIPWILLGLLRRPQLADL